MLAHGAMNAGCEMVKCTAGCNTSMAAVVKWVGGACIHVHPSVCMLDKSSGNITQRFESQTCKHVSMRSDVRVVCKCTAASACASSIKQRPISTVSQFLVLRRGDLVAASANCHVWDLQALLGHGLVGV